MSEFTYAFSLYFSNGLSWDELDNTISTTVGLTSWTGTTIANGQITFTFSDVIVENNLITVLENHIPDQTPFYLDYANPGNWTAGNLLTYLIPYGATSLSLDTYALIGFDLIPDVPTINAAIAAYVEPPVITDVQVLLSSANNYLTTDTGDTLVTLNPQEIIVSQVGRSQFNTIAGAVASISPGTTYVITVYPGTYVETNPIVLPANCSLRAEGFAVNTLIVAAVPTSPVLQTSAGNLIDSFTIVGGTYGISHNGSDASSFSVAQGCIFSNTGVYITGGYGSLLLSSVFFAFTATDNSSFTAITVDGGSLVSTNTEIQGTLSSLAAGGLIATNNALATIDVFSVNYCTNAVAIKNNSIVKSTLINIENCANGCVVLPNDIGYTSTLSRYFFGTLNIENSTTYDLNIQANASLQYLSAQFDDGKIYNPTNVTINSNAQIYRNTINYQLISGTILFGSEAIPSTTANGTNFNSNNMLCYLYDGTTYIDESANFRIPSNPPVTLTSQTLFICHKTAIIYGFDIYSTITTNPTLAYWNGTAWTNLKYSIYDITNNVFSTTMIPSASLYFDSTYVPQQTTVNSVSAYWIRVSPGNCTISSTTLHSNIVYTNSIGHSRKYGLGRSTKQIQIPPNILSNTVYFMPTADFDYSSPYTITVYADAGIIINGTPFSGNSGSVTAYASGQSLQSISIAATNIKAIIIGFLSI